METISAATSIGGSANADATLSEGGHPAEWPPLGNTHWRSLYYFNIYRLLIAGILLAAYWGFGERIAFGQLAPRLFVLAGVLLLVAAAAALMAAKTRWPRYELQVTGNVAVDIVFINVLMYASGGIGSGLGLLILVSLAASSLVARGRLAMFHAALATIAVLFQQIYLSYAEAGPAEYLQAALLSIAYFATAGLAYFLAKRLTASEEFARRQSIDLANLDAVNRLVIQDLQDGVVVVDGHNRVRQVNAQAERILGLPPGLHHDLTIERLSPDLAARFAQWRASGEINVLPLRIPGSSRSTRARFMAIGTGRNGAAVIFLEDLTRLQAQAQQLKLAALGRLTANIAHEIRNPLSAIGHATQLLQEEEAQDATHARLLEIIRDNTFRLDRMVQDILQLNRKDRGEPEPIRLAEYLENFRLEFCQVERLPPEALTVEAVPGLEILFDRHHLHQVLWNLCRNAWRHSRQQAGSVRLLAEKAHAENVVQLDVLDDGPGVAPEAQAQLFEPFFTTESTGTGLGLYIARQLTEANGATLDYIELAPGGLFRICAKGVGS